jgi:hypothetical protein
VIGLAPSGAGKTWSRANLTQPIINAGLGDYELHHIPTVITSAALFDHFCLTGLPEDKEKELTEAAKAEIIRQRSASIWIRDEAGEWFKKMNSGADEDLKDSVLRMYDGDPLERQTRKDGVRRTQRLAVSIYATAVDESFFKQVHEDDFTNGLMQRFLLALCHDRPDWRRGFYTIAGRDAVGEKWKEQWQKILQGPQKYVSTPAAMDAFEKWFKATWETSPDQESYIRRYAWSAFKYAAILRAVSEADGVIDVPTLELGLKIVARHLADLNTCLTDYTHVDKWGLMLDKVERAVMRQPYVTRGELLKNVGVSSRDLNLYLETLAEIHQGKGYGDGDGEVFQRLRSAAKHGGDRLAEGASSGASSVNYFTALTH